MKYSNVYLVWIKKLSKITVFALIPKCFPNMHKRTMKIKNKSYCSTCLFTMLFVPKRIITGVITATTPTINQSSTNALYLSLEPLSLLFNFVKLWRPTMMRRPLFIIPSLIEWGLYCNHLVRPSVRLSVRLSVRPFTL